MDTDAQLAPLEDACTIILLRDGAAGLETLMLKRPGNSRAFGGAWVFPGGKVDPEDRVDGAGATLDELASAQVAGLRELTEETGQKLGVDDLAWLAQWTPMQDIPRRFRTWFMLAAAVSTDVVINPVEHECFEWLAPSDALARHAEGKMALVPPTWVTLHNLQAVDSVAQAMAAARDSRPAIYNTHLLMPDAGSRLGATGTTLTTALPDMMGVRPKGVLWDGDEEYPAGAGSATVQGTRHRLTMTSLPWVFECTGP